MNDRDKFIALFSPFADGTYNGSGTIVDGTKVEDVVDHLLAQGVIVPPCKVGDMLINKKNGFIGEVDSIHIYRNGFPKITITDGMLDTTFAVFSLDWFEPLTKEQAKEKLKELKDND